MAKQTFKILFVASEVTPYAKTGGLADVASALPSALKALGHDVRVVMPYYRMAKETGKPVRTILDSLEVPIADRRETARLLEGELPNGTPIYFLQKDSYYDREFLYGTPQGDYPDNAERFMYFSRAIPELLRALSFRPDVIHCNDWQTGLVPVYLKTLYQDDPLLKEVASLYTIHNLAFQGLFWHLDMPLTGLPPQLFSPEGIEFYGKINLTKAGIVFADIITTVSKKYSQEIQTPEYGCGLEGVLRARSAALYGILNGADYGEWNPASDDLIAAKYDLEHLEGKKLCKKDLLTEYDLSHREHTPVLGMISRLNEQKGCDILLDVLGRIVDLDVTFVLLGTGDEKYQYRFQALQRQYPDRIGVKFEFNNRLAHKIEAGADMFLMPSRFEPCGLSQIYSLKYGTIPIVRATGGLDDTIQNYRVKTGRGNGFKFQAYLPEALFQKTMEAVTLYRQNPKAWHKLMQNAMKADFSWQKSTRQYLEVYRIAKERKTERL